MFRPSSVAGRRIQRLKQPRDYTVKSIPAPVGGWNARDSLPLMPEEDAVSLINWVPTATACTVRGGFSKWSTGLPSQVETLMAYNSGTASKLFAISSTAVYDITAGGAVGAASISGLTNARWQYINVSTAGGSFLLMVNGVDKLRGFDGTNWWTDGDGTHDISGVNTATCIDIQLHNNRVWLIQKNTLLAWYLPLSSIAGTAVSFDFRSIFRKGGQLVSMGTWTIDAGYGLNDQAAFITSMGEVAVYIGLDPSSTATWAKIGLYQMGSPIGNRPFTKFGGDLLLINYDGLTPLAQGLQSSRLDPRVNLTDKIRGAMATATSTYASNFGWQVMDFPKQSLLVLNVPVMEGGSQEQYVMSTVTKNWTKFQGWNANCWVLYNDDAYFGANTFVGMAYDTQADASANITATAVQAFTPFGDRGSIKRCTMIQPIFQTDGTPSAVLGVNTDFNQTTPGGDVSFTAPDAGVWDDPGSLWDHAKWGGGIQTSQAWQGANAIGKYFGASMITQTNAITLQWAATNFMLEIGGVLGA